MRRILVSLAAAAVPPAAIWLAGGELFQRGEAAAWAFILSVLSGGWALVVQSVGGWRRPPRSRHPIL
jgi:hypothetical protein